MLTGIDRVQLAVPDRAEVARLWIDLLDAEPAGEDRIDALGASRTLLRLGDGWIELLEPDGPGPVTDAVTTRGGHLYAAGAATGDLEAFAAHLQDLGVEASHERGQIFLTAQATGGHGLCFVISADEALEPVGLVDGLYEVTNLVHDSTGAMDLYAGLFGLDPTGFVPIESSHYGYEGVLTLFSADHLDRLEVITPSVPTNTMGRFFSSWGESLYMAFAEVREPGEIAQRAEELGAAFTPVPPPAKRGDQPPDTVFIHPPALGGMMLGLSRRSLAWLWSGHAEWVGSYS